MAATSLPRVPDGGGGGGGALGFEFEPPCGPSSEARATVGTANTSNAIRHRLDTESLSFFMSILLLFFATLHCDVEVEVERSFEQELFYEEYGRVQSIIPVIQLRKPVAFILCEHIPNRDSIFRGADELSRIGSRDSGIVLPLDQE